jgi:uncharacterized membrane protein
MSQDTLLSDEHGLPLTAAAEIPSPPPLQAPVEAEKTQPAEKSVIIFKPEAIELPAVGSASAMPEPADSKLSQVHVASNLLDLVSGRVVTIEDQQAVKRQRDLNHIVHQVLVIGLVISTSLLLVGLALDLFLGREVPQEVPDLTETFVRVIALRPSGFLTLGMLVLIVTPIVRVFGSIAVFIYERDWRYAGITFMVLVVVMTSLIAGNG